MRIIKLLAIAIVFASLPTVAVAQPEAVVVEPIKDVGAVSRGAQIKHTFQIRNEGDQELTVREVQPACGCTVAEFDRTIAPGAVGRVEAVVDTKDFHGPIAKSIKVFTTDPENARFDLVIKADVRSQIETRPGFSRIVVIQGEKVESSRQWLWRTDGAALEIESVKSPYPFLEVSHHRATAEERKDEGAESQWIIDLQLSEDAPVGPMADHVIAQTNDPKQRQVRIPVSGFVRPVVSVRPKVATFGRLELTGPFSATFDVQNLSTGSISVLGATTDVAGVASAIEEVEAGKRYRVKVTLPQEMAKGPFEGTLEIQTSSERMPLVEVKMSGTIL